MKVGDYVRTKDGIIDKVIIEYNGHCASPNCNCKHISCERNYYDEDKVIKSSPNIIDLIEVGDYVNGSKVIDKWEEPEWYDYFIKLEGEKTVPTIRKIESIVTKEQFKTMEYKVGETNE